VSASRPAYLRLPVVATVVLLALALLAARLVWLGTVAAEGVSARTAEYPIPAPRGSLWDRRGALVATESYAFTVGVATDGVEDGAPFAAQVAPVVGADPAQLAAALAEPGRRWLALRSEGDPVDYGTALRLEALELAGLNLEALSRRTYSLGEALGHVTGLLTYGGQAVGGVEAYYDRELVGQPGSLMGHSGTDPRGFRSARAGVDLVLTIDRPLQLAAAEALAQVVAAQSAAGGTILVLEPASGAILASTSLPSFDPNHYGQADPAHFADPAISAHYEPGSVMKAMTMAAALESGVVTPDSTYEDTGTVQVEGLTIPNYDALPHGTTSMTQLLQHSLNVGAVHLAQLTGVERFYATLSAFGYGAPTQVDLSGEVAGIVHAPSTEDAWWPGHLAFNSFGQGISATPLQVAAAMAAIANDGWLMTPHIVAARIPPGGAPEPVAPRPVRQVVSATTAAAVRRMLGEVVSGRVTQAAVPGYSIGGKTGTSQIPVAGGYDDEGTVASFCGFLPVEAPRVVILVKVDRPHVPRGSDVAAPLFAEVARAAIRILDLPPDRPVAAAGGGATP
jgi:cell division protein FtsI/penicillin-binding protein 2